MKFVLIDYYFIVFIIFMLVCSTFLSYSSYYSTCINSNSLKDKINLVFIENKFFKNIIYPLLNLFKLIFFIFIFYFILNTVDIGIEKIYNYLIYKNIFFISKVSILILITFFLYLFNQYIKIFKWFDFEILILLLFSCFSLINIIHVENFFTFYLILEFYSIIIATVIGLKKTRVSAESAFKYFIFNAISSSFILFSISIFYMFTGIYTFSNLHAFFAFFNIIEHINLYFVYIGFIFILIGFLMKLTVIPFNYWIIDVYDGSPTVITFFLLLIPKFSFTMLLIKLCYCIFMSINFFWTTLILVIIIISNIVNNFAAIYQIKFKKLIIYASFSNIFFFLLPLYLKNFFSIIIFFAFFTIYFLNMFFLFFIYNNLINISIWNITIIKKITFFLNFIEINKALTYIFVSIVLSLAGLPPFSGFFAKFYYLVLLVDSGNLILFFLISFFNIFTIYYYVRLMKLLFQFELKYKLVIFKNELLIFFLIIFFLLIYFLFFILIV